MKLRSKFLIAVSALSLIFSLVMVVDRTLGFRHAMLERTQDRTDYLAEFITELSAHYLETGNTPRLKELLRSFDHFQNISYLKVVDARGAIVYRMAGPGFKLTDKAPDQDVFHTVDEIFDTSREIFSGGAALGHVYLGVSVKGVDEAVAALAWRAGLIGVGFTAFITFAAWLLSIKLGKELTWLLDIAENVKSEKLPELPSGALGSDTGNIASTLKDLHGRLRLEEGRRLEAETQRNDFFEMTVHDLKQPVTALKAAMDLLLSEEERRNYSPKQVESLSNIARTSLSLLTTMITDVLNTAKLNNPQYQPERERVDLQAFLKRCAPENAASVAAAGKKWECEFAPELSGCWIFGDQDLIRRVIGNLVLNAIQYTPEGGKIKLGARLHDADRAAIYVSDEGEGIPDGFRREIFKKYSTMSRSSKNLGLGLAFCKLAADRHSAFLDVKSEQGKGTEISFVIPVYCPASRAGQDGEGQRP
jgi:signal transduction histidine kinase